MGHDTRLMNWCYNIRRWRERMEWSQLDGLWERQKVEGWVGYPDEEAVQRMELGRGGLYRRPPVCPIDPFHPAGVWRPRRWTSVCSRSWGWGMVAASSSGLSSAPLLLFPSTTAPPSCPSPLRRSCCRWALAAAVASVLWMRWMKTACRRSGRGDCCGRDGCGVTRGLRAGGRVRENVRTAGWSRGTAAYPGPAGLVWCRSSLVSSWVSQ